MKCSNFCTCSYPKEAIEKEQFLHPERSLEATEIHKAAKKVPLCHGSSLTRGIDIGRQSILRLAQSTVSHEACTNKVTVKAGPPGTRIQNPLTTMKATVV